MIGFIVGVEFHRRKRDIGEILGGGAAVFAFTVAHQLLRGAAGGIR